MVASEGMVEGWTEGVALKRSAHGLVAGEDAPGVGFVCTWIDVRKCGGTYLTGRGGEPGNSIGAVGVRFQHS